MEMEPSNTWNPYQTADSGTAAGEFTRLSHSISTQVQKISQNASSIQRMAAQLGTPADTDQFRHKLHETQHYTLTLSRETSDLLKQLTNLPAPTNHDDQRQQKLIRERLTNDFSTVLNNFQTIQRSVKEKEKASFIRARAESGILEDESKGAGIDLTPQQRLQVEQNVDVQALKEREQAIKQLESDIGDVNQIFKDLALMVHEQGEMIDSIEANVDSAQIHVDQGASQIAKAAMYQEKVRRRKIMWIIVGIICVLILILILYFIFH